MGSSGFSGLGSRLCWIGPKWSASLSVLPSSSFKTTSLLVTTKFETDFSLSWKIAFVLLICFLACPQGCRTPLLRLFSSRMNALSHQSSLAAVHYFIWHSDEQLVSASQSFCCGRKMIAFGRLTMEYLCIHVARQIAHSVLCSFGLRGCLFPFHPSWTWHYFGE